MRKYKLRYADYFREELYEILEYISNNLYKSTISKFLDKVVNCTDNLTYFPKMYARYERINKYRRIIIKNYIIFYNIDNYRKNVEIKHIYYSRKISFNLD